MYKSIHYLPVENWWQLHITGELHNLLENEEEVIDIDKLNSLWESMNSEFIERYGTEESSQEIERLLFLKKTWVINKVNSIINKDLSAEMQADLAQLEIDRIEKVDKHNQVNDNYSSNADNVIFLEEKKGYDIDTRVMSVVKFYDNMNYYTKNDGKK